MLGRELTRGTAPYRSAREGVGPQPLGAPDAPLAAQHPAPGTRHPAPQPVVLYFPDTPCPVAICPRMRGGKLCGGALNLEVYQVDGVCRIDVNCGMCGRTAANWRRVVGWRVFEWVVGEEVVETAPDAELLLSWPTACNAPTPPVDERDTVPLPDVDDVDEALFDDMWYEEAERDDE